MTVLLPDSYIVLVGNVFVKVITHNGQIWTNIWVKAGQLGELGW